MEPGEQSKEAVLGGLTYCSAAPVYQSLCRPQHIQKHQQKQLQMQMQIFWAEQYREIEQTTDFRNHSLPLARIKKIMKADEDVRMIAAEAPVVFARACEMFIFQLTTISWANAEENKRRTLQRNDVVAAITRTEIFDFLVDVIPGDIAGNEVIPETTINDPLPAYYFIPQ